MESLIYYNSIESDSFDYDCNEVLNISSLSLVKMLRHGKAGIPIEVMGLMLGKFETTTCIQVRDVFAMPQTGTGVSVEAIDPVFQTKMLEMYEQNGNTDIIVGWYHSHPGFGCWLSGVDINTQQNFEYLNKRSVAVVIDPIQSVKGKIVIEGYRLNSPLHRVHETRETTSIYSMVNNSGLFREDHGLNKYYYSLRIGFRKNLLEEITISSIFQKDNKKFLQTAKKKQINLPRFGEIIRSLVSSLRKFSSDESFSPNNIQVNLIQNFQDEINEIKKLIQCLINKLSISCLSKLLVDYIL